MTLRSSRAPTRPAMRCASSSPPIPGQQYRFASVELPGLDAAGPDAARLRDIFAVKAGDPVIAADVIAGGLALTQALGEEGFASAKIGEQDIEVNHQTHLASLDPAGRSRAGRPVRHDPRQRPAAVQRASRRDHRPVQARRPVPAVEDRRSAAGADRDDAGRQCRHPGRPGEGRPGGRPRRSAGAGAAHTIAGELGYGTGQGARLEASWTDRNFFNPEGALTLRGIAGTTEQLLGVQFRRSNFLQRDQTLNAAVLGVAPEVRRLHGEDRRSCREHRAAEQLHLAEEMDLVLRRRVAGDRRARRVQQRRDQGHARPSSSPRCRWRSAMTAATICSIPTRGFRLGRPSQPGDLVRTAATSPMRARRSTRAPTIRFPTVSCSPAASGSARSSAPACSTSRRRGASIRAAAGRCAATAISSSGPRIRTATRSAAAASPSSGWRPGFG